MQNDLHCVDVQLLKEDNKTLEDTTEMINQFSSHIKQIKVEKSLAVDDFTRVSKVESMLIVCLDHLYSHRDKVKMVKRKKELWKHRVINISLPHVTVIQEFSKVHREWIVAKAVMVSVQNTNPSDHWNRADGMTSTAGSCSPASLVSFFSFGYAVRVVLY